MSRRRRHWPVVLLAVVLLAAPAPWGPLAAAAVLTARLGVAGGRRLVRRFGPRWRAAASRPPTDAVALGRDDRGRPVVLTETQLGAHALVVGASGAGKSTTLETILADRIARGAPVVAIDMKGSPSFQRALAAAAADAGRELLVWTPDGPTHWNPLAHGGPTALKDRLISAERFSEPHYQRSAERYLQSVLQVLSALNGGRAPTLSQVVGTIEPARLGALAARVPAPLGPRVRGYLATLSPDQLSAARGLGTRLALLSESDAGRWLEPAPAPGTPSVAAGHPPRTMPAPAAPTLDLGTALSGGPVALVSINSAVYGALGAQLGALAVQDLTSAAGRRLATSAPDAPAATVAIDEFSALGADHVLALLARGREAGVGVLLATQELADLERAGRGFRDQVLGITAVTLAHRQEVHESALAISRMAGTRTEWRETETIPAGLAGLRGGPSTRGTRHRHEVPVVHPNAIKRLSTGQLVLLSGVPQPTVARVRVQPPARAARRPPPRRGIRSTDRDQPAPGVTR